MLRFSVYRHSSVAAANINIRFVTPTVAKGAILGEHFAYSFGGKPSEIAWKPSAAAAVNASKSKSTSTDKDSNPIDLFVGVGAKPNTETLMKATFSAVRKARDMNRDKIDIAVPTVEFDDDKRNASSAKPPVTMKVTKNSDCTTTNMLGMFNANQSGDSTQKVQKHLNEDELVEKLSLYSHLAVYEYNAKKTGAFLKKGNGDDDEKEYKEAYDKLINYKPQISISGYKSSNKNGGDTSSSSFVKTGKIIATNVNIARTWQNIRPDIGSPNYFAEEALGLLGLKGGSGKSSSSSSSTLPNVRVVDIIRGKKLQEKGMNLHYSVGKGASDKNQPVLVVLEYKGNPKSDKATALVGKGVVMDTGGLNVKPYGSMETMNQDMGGAAGCFGAFKSAVELRLEQNIVLVMGFANNACSGDAYHPSEIITSLKGTTVEVLNTDAEGRLILADCLTYVQKHADLTNHVDTIIDVATLTGAMCVALGDDRAGIFANDATLMRRLVAASEDALEPLWPMPIGPEHHKKLRDGTLADMMNVSAGRYGGACTAAAFLHHFIEKHDDCLEFRGLLKKNKKQQQDTTRDKNEEDDNDSNEKKNKNKMNRWAHLDIAGPGMGGSKATDRNPPGSTGYGVSLLTEYFRRL